MNMLLWCFQTMFMIDRGSIVCMRYMTEVDERLDAHSFPATSEELIDAYGSIELAFPDGTETFGEALSRLESETYETVEGARLAAYSALSEEAIGRKGYSDRDPTNLGEDGHDEVSF